MQPQDNMAERGGIHQHSRMPSVMRGISPLQEEEIADYQVRLHSTDNLHTTLIHIDIFLLIPSPDILNQRLKTQHGTFGAGGMKCPPFPGAEEDICV